MTPESFKAEIPCETAEDLLREMSPSTGRLWASSRDGRTEREWIFRKFYRAESAARDGAAGTGLGLFIAKELVNAMGGRIWVDSTEGEGSSFAFELPAARD